MGNAETYSPTIHARASPIKAIQKQRSSFMRSIHGIGKFNNVGLIGDVLLHSRFRVRRRSAITMNEPATVPNVKAAPDARNV